MKKLFTAIFVLVDVFLSFSMSSAYDVAKGLQFPLSPYDRGDNKLGAYNYINNNKFHLGEDAHAIATTRVYAIGNGKVIVATNTHKDYGGMYVIEHTFVSGERVCSLYAHLNFNTFTKHPGDDVYKGEFIGEIGTFAQNGGWPEHLHFGIRKGGYPANPNEYVCADWILSGYTACEYVVNNWYNPTEFLNGDLYRLVGNLAWYPPNKACIYAERWIFFSGGYPNGGQSIGYSSICVQEEYKMMMALGGAYSDWQKIIYGYGDLSEVLTCHQ